MRLQNLVLLPVLAALIVAGALIDPATFLSAGNLIGVLRQQTELSLLVLAQAIVLIGGRIDLSLESTAGLAPALAVALVVPAAANGLGAELPVWLAIPLCLLAGIAIGAFNGLLTVRFQLSAFAATLATLILLRGLHLGLMGGRDLLDLPASVAYLGSASWLGLPTSIWICALIFAAGIAYLGFFRYGRAVYAIGGNPHAARAAGVPADRVLWIVFGVGGALAALAGLLMAGRLGSIGSAHGQGMIFTVLAAAMIGGVSLNGGRGTLFGALCGVLVLGLVGNVLTLAGIDAHWIPAAYGVVVLVALLLAHRERVSGAQAR